MKDLAQRVFRGAQGGTEPSHSASASAPDGSLQPSGAGAERPLVEPVAPVIVSTWHFPPLPRAHRAAPPVEVSSLSELRGVAARIVELLLAGLAPMVVARELGVTPAYVYNVRQRWLKTAAAEPGENTCGVCREAGHNARTCPSRGEGGV